MRLKLGVMKVEIRGCKATELTGLIEHLDMNSFAASSALSFSVQTIPQYLVTG